MSTTPSVETVAGLCDAAIAINSAQALLLAMKSIRTYGLDLGTVLDAMKTTQKKSQ